jgi:uracil phosphoribosyltransferase
MQVHILSESNSILKHFLSQLRDVSAQKDSMRFRKNVHRIGEIMAYEISKALEYESHEVTTPLGSKHTGKIQHGIVVTSILRAGLALHEGFISFFDDAENGFISAYRHHPNNDDYFDIVTEYKAAPSLENKTVIIADPMLATGLSLQAACDKLLENEKPAAVHIAVVIAAPEGIEFLQKTLPDHFHLWVADVDSHLNEKKYIVPGLGDAGDLAYGVKL